MVGGYSVERVDNAAEQPELVALAGMEHSSSAARGQRYAATSKTRPHQIAGCVFVLRRQMLAAQEERSQPLQIGYFTRLSNCFRPIHAHRDGPVGVEEAA